MAIHWDTTAPLAGRVDQRRGHIIARVIGTLALVGFMLALATGTARAGVLDEIIEELPVDIGPGQEPAPATEPPPVEPTPQEPAQSGDAVGLGEVIEKVAGPVVQPVEEIVEPVVDTVEQPVGEVVGAVQPVVGSGRPVVGIVEGSVNQVTEQVAPGVAGIRQPVIRVIDPTLDLIDDPAGSVSGLVDEVRGRVLDRVNAVVNVPELLGGLPELISVTEDLIVGLVDTVDRTGEPGSDPAGPIDLEARHDGRQTNPTRPPSAGHATGDLVPLPALPEIPGLPGESTIQIDDIRAPLSDGWSAPATAADPPLVAPLPESNMGQMPVDDVDKDLAAQTRPLKSASTAPSSSNSGPATGLVAVLVLLGLIRAPVEPLAPASTGSLAPNRPGRGTRTPRLATSIPPRA